MEVMVRYSMASKCTISSISYNPVHNILALTGDGNDTANFYTIDMQNLALDPKFTGESKPPTSGIISWSPNGQMIAVANQKVEIWKFENGRLIPLRIINEGFIEIKNIRWDFDGSRYLCYGINHKDSPLSINIRSIQSNELRQIIVQEIPILVNFDPFGKYITLLGIKNVLELYDAKTLQKIKIFNLADSAKDVPTLCDRRLADWSPDYSFLSIPNLNDTRVPTAIILDRNQNFACKDILLGHPATITCMKFNHQVFEFEGDYTFILAVGDSSGCISLWRIGKKNTYKQPLIIASPPKQVEQSAQNFQWSERGDILFANVLKKYVMLFKFNLEDFGRMLALDQKNSLIISIYGATDASEIVGRKLEVFGQSNLQKDQTQNVNTFSSKVQSNFQKEQKGNEPLVKTQQKVIINKGEKKRIIPSRHVTESQAAQEKQKEVQGKISTTNQPQNLGIKNIIQSQNIPILKIPPLKEDIKRQYLLKNQSILEIQTTKNMTTLTIKSFSQSNSSTRYLNGEIKWIKILQNQLLIVNSQKLFIFDFNLVYYALPCFVGEISNITVNNNGTVFSMNTVGTINGFNYVKQEFICQTSIAYLLMGRDEQIKQSPFLSFHVFDDDDNKLHIQLRQGLGRFFYDKTSNSWHQFDFSEGFYIAGHSLRITKLQKTLANDFYAKLIFPAISPLHNKNQSILNQFEMQILYYQTYSKDTTKYNNALLRLIAYLKSNGKEQQLRKTIARYFSYQNLTANSQLWEKVKKIGGKVVQQFLILQNV